MSFKTSASMKKLASIFASLLPVYAVNFAISWQEQGLMTAARPDEKVTNLSFDFRITV